LGTKIVLAAFCVFASGLLRAQSGCTDPQAMNYDASALFNDGTCLYSPTNDTPTLVQNLSSRLIENSGMLVWDDHIWMLNDGGSLPMLFKLDLSGNIVDSVLVSSSTNVDWEGLTQSSTHFYIGDFGNNAGNRTDLAIYQVSKSDLSTTTTHSVPAEKRVFKYTDQHQFNGPSNGHAFDCEGLYYDHDSLVLLTKNWNNFYAKRYRMPAIWQDTLSISPVDSMFMDGLITDVSFDSSSNKVLALGYKNNGSNFYTSFVYLLFDFNGSDIFSGNKRRLELGNMLSLAQTEGIAWIDSVHAFISSEQISSIITIPPKLFSCNFTSYFSGNVGVADQQSQNIYPNPCAGFIQIPEVLRGKKLAIYSVSGHLEKEQQLENESYVDVSDLPNGSYFMSIGEFHFRLIKAD
jgi:hypothetical protein